jgi:hypothetical protein
MELLPPPEGVFDTHEEALNYAQTFARDQGYAITKRRTKFTMYCEAKQLQTASLHCSKGGTWRNRATNEENRTKEIISRLTNCPFHAAIRRRNKGNTYLLTIECPDHNHDPTPPVALPQHRELSSTAQDTIYRLTMSGDRPRQIASVLQLEDPTQLLIQQDIYNERKRIREVNLGGQTPIEALFAQLQEGNYFMAYNTLNTREITHLFFTNPKSVEL